MCNFKVGDKVKVVKGRGHGLPLGSLHTVHEIYETDYGVFVALSDEEKQESIGWNIDRFVKYEEKEKQMKVEIGKKYRMVGTHEPVRIICVDRLDPEVPCIALYKSGKDEGVLYLNTEGKDCFGGWQIIEEVPAVDWSKVKVDTPIYVKYAGDILKRHFNKFDGEHVYFYPFGTTSFTYPGDLNFTAHITDCWLEEPK